jgi:diguanylate cyclase (GGDEF)-like protein
MRTRNTYFVSETQLNTFVRQHHLQDSAQLLIQVFTAKNRLDFLSNLTHFFATHFPLATLIGCTTDGEIKDGLVSTHKTVISFSVFESVRLSAYISDRFEDYEQAGRDLASAIVSEETKVLIAFIDSLSGNGEDFLRGASATYPNVTIAGGLAGDNGAFKQTYVFTKENIVSNGVVGVSLNSSSLMVFTDYCFNWLPIGKKLRITKAEGNRVYTIDDQPACDIYEYYLGKDVKKHFPSIGVEFPLIIQRGDMSVARSPLGKEKDGSIVFAGNFTVGDEVRFGYGDADIILDEMQKHMADLVNITVESVFIYSCMARRRFIPNDIELETSAYHQIAPTSGFFTYGEFFSRGSSKALLNQSMTVLALSETYRQQDDHPVFQYVQHESTTIQALAHLISVSVKELEAAQQALKVLAETDSLTSLYNRRYLLEMSDRLYRQYAEDKTPLSVMMLDIDKFKHINDTYGHVSGDYVLVQIAQVLQESLSAECFICRYGGEEFVVLLPNMHQHQAVLIAEDIRQRVEKRHMVLADGQVVACTISLGVAELTVAKDHSFEQLLRRSDEALYMAKNSGRNRVVAL